MSTQTKTYFASIWPTDDCNLKCRPCFFHDSDLWKFTPTYMTTEIADQVIQYINTGIIEGVSFFGSEPMLNWPIIKRILIKTHETIIRSATQKWTGSVYNLTTNGTCFTPENIEDLALHDVHINFSFDGLPETQNFWRNNSYDEALEHRNLLIEYPSLSILKLMADPATLYEDIKHIKELGFTSVFINMLDEFSQYTYRDYSLADYLKQYRRVIKELHDPENFEVLDYTAIGNSIKFTLENPPAPGVIGCGYRFRGLGIAPDGKLYPCHQAQSLGEAFSIGDIWNGINTTTEAKIRNVPNAPSCTRCVYRQSQCYVQMYLKHHRFGVDPPPWSREWMIAKFELIQELQDLPTNTNYACREDPFENVLQNMLESIQQFPVSDIQEINLEDK